MPSAARRRDRTPPSVVDLGAIPSFLTPNELTEVAFRRANKINVAHIDLDAAGVARACAKLDSVSETLRTHLDRIVQTFPLVDGLHPFYQELLEATVDVPKMRKSLGAVAWARDEIGLLARRGASTIRRGGRVHAGPTVAATYGRIASVLRQVRRPFLVLNDARKSLRSIPAIDPRVPTVVIAGAPNVGKSLLVAKLSSGRPAVASYPFTTKELQLGHFTARGRRFQVVDTPGLLDRPLEKRNPMERRAILALAHLPTVVLFLMDPTETCGFPLDTQERLLESIKRSIKAPLLVVENKGDMAEGPGRRLRVSALTGAGIEELRKLLVVRLEEVLVVNSPPAPEFEEQDPDDDEAP